MNINISAIFIYPKKVLVTFVTDFILNNYVKSCHYLFVALIGYKYSGILTYEVVTQYVKES